MTVIGLTGKTGSGKSTVCSELKKQGVFIIDTDVIAREIVEKNSPALEKLYRFFGDDILNKDKTLNRKALAQIAFSCKENTSKLNEITHPYITKKVGEKIDFARAQGFRYCVIDAAALLESECKNFCDVIAVVSASEQTRLERILKRDNLSVDDALKRMNAQKDDEYYLKNADIIIMNNDGDSLELSVKKLFEFLEEKDENN